MNIPMLVIYKRFRNKKMDATANKILAYDEVAKNYYHSMEKLYIGIKVTIALHYLVPAKPGLVAHFVRRDSDNVDVMYIFEGKLYTIQQKYIMGLKKSDIKHMIRLVTNWQGPITFVG